VLTCGDRKKAVDLIKEIHGTEQDDLAGVEQIQELQRMLMLNIKAEIQAVDNFGDITDWLDDRLCM
jgi:meiotic recombination protein SPO11